ncbi:MAG: FKBP-type peptidyl-prolyl cis-trans isomerase [Bacteroidales bacterium]|nr:FKBP-type peptidyl-prolyl cis-trans isomerase [Bacteroidales bacterium]
MNWKILKTSGLILVLSIFIVSCNNPHPGFKKTKSGIYYSIISQIDSLKDIKADSGQFYIMEMNYGTQDSMFFKSELLPDQIVKIPHQKVGFPGDIWEALQLLSKGDSAHFIIRADSFFLKTTRAPEIPELFKKDNEVHFFVNVKNIQTREEIEAEHAAYVNARKFAEQIEISKFVADNNWTIQPNESGLYINKIKDGTGRKVKEGYFLTFDFEIRNLDGSLIYSSIESNYPGKYEYGKRFDTQGLMEAMQTMRQGDEVELLVPSALAYGEGGRPGMIEPHTPLHYFVRLTAVKTPAENEAEKEAMRKAEEAQKEALRLQEASTIAKYIAENEITVEPTASGLYFISTQEGEGEQAVAGNKVKVHYSGTLLDGTKFDSSYDRDQPFEFTLGQGQVIKGWDEGIAMLKVGGKATLILPSSIAYGDRQAGNVIKPYSPLKFEVELVEIVKE